MLTSRVIVVAVYVRLAGVSEVLQVDGPDETTVVRSLQNAISDAKTITYAVAGAVLTHRIVNLRTIEWAEVTTAAPANETTIIRWAIPGGSQQIF